jgi:hypothetical protein
MFFLQEGFTYRNFLMDALAIFVFILWFWLLITVSRWGHALFGQCQPQLGLHLDHTRLSQCKQRCR